MRTSNEINELAKALSRAQGQFTSAERAHVAKVQSKKGEGSSYSYSYADLQAYLDVVREPLAGAGLSFVQLPTVASDQASVVTILMHESGQFIESDPLTLGVDHEPDKRPTPQAIGSAITYARRYSLSAITGMASEADDDGAGASGLNAETGRREPLPNCPKCGNNQNVIKGREEYGGGWLCWKKPEQGKHGCGHKWQSAPEESSSGFSPHGDERNEAGEGHATKKSNGSKASEVAGKHGLKTGAELEAEQHAFDAWADMLVKATPATHEATLKTLKRAIGDGRLTADFTFKIICRALERAAKPEHLEGIEKLMNPLVDAAKIPERDSLKFAELSPAAEDRIGVTAAT